MCENWDAGGVLCPPHPNFRLFFPRTCTALYAAWAGVGGSPQLWGWGFWRPAMPAANSPNLYLLMAVSPPIWRMAAEQAEGILIVNKE